MPPDLPPLTLYPSRRKWAYVAAVCAVIAALGFLEIRTGDAVERTFGWLFGAFFGCGLIVAVINLLPQASYLRVDAEGFVARAAFRTTSLRWSDVGAFSVAAMPGVDLPALEKGPIGKFVVFNFADGPRKPGAAARWSARISGHEGALPDTYRMTAEDLAALLNQYRTASVA